MSALSGRIVGNSETTREQSTVVKFLITTVDSRTLVARGKIGVRLSIWQFGQRLNGGVLALCDAHYLPPILS
jgi:hypothetical protein